MSFMMLEPRALLLWVSLANCALALGGSSPETPRTRDGEGTKALSRPAVSAPSPWLRPKARPRIDDVLERPYDGEVPMGCLGDRLWATSPQGFGFDDGVHDVYISNFVPYRLRIPGYRAKSAMYRPSHVHVVGERGSNVEATASFTFTIDGVDRPLSKPFARDKRWTCWNSKHREDWWAADFGSPAVVRGAVLYFYDDSAEGGACRPPESVKIEAWDAGTWKPVENVTNEKGEPSADANRFRFKALKADRLRFTFKNRGQNYYTGLYGFDPEFEEPPRAVTGDSVEVSSDKFITRDDIVVTSILFKNPGTSPATIAVDWELPWLDPTAPRELWDGRTPIVENTTSKIKIGDRNVQVHFRAELDGPYVAVDVTPGRPGADPRRPGALRALVQPRGSVVLTLKLAIAGAEAAIDGARLAAAGSPAVQAAEYQEWFDRNVATFECSDPYITKMFWHRAYLLKKNFMNPREGRIQRRAATEGRWRSDWYHNIISYGAGHQVREARWFADPSYSWGHLLTWVENPRKDQIYPSHIRPEGEKGGQYTDWISSTALDAMAVHPDMAALKAAIDPLARNARAWIAVYDKDNDFLPVVDSHWWTGMEWQPSFFAFNQFKPDEGDPYEADLERVDLAAYAYGDARNVARCAELAGDTRTATELHALADNIKNAVEKKLWNADWQFFLSNRYKDDAPALVKEVIGVYPFYFGLPTPGKGYEAAWKSLVDPEEFWSEFPVRSCSKKCPAYMPTRGWAAGRNVLSGCMWNGPTWPHANSIVLTAMARTLREYPKCDLTRKHLLNLFQSFTMAQYRNQDMRYPWTGEYYRTDTGEWLTGERDYNHSTWLDVLIPDLCGLVPRQDDTIEIDPLLPADGAWTHFLLDGQFYRGHTLTIVWDAPDGVKHYEGLADEGLTLFVDGKQRAHRADLGTIKLKL